MCNLYLMTKSKAAIIAIARAMHDRTGNLPTLPGNFLDYQRRLSNPHGCKGYATQ
jgi:hypothetical protein